MKTGKHVNYKKDFYDRLMSLSTHIHIRRMKNLCTFGMALICISAIRAGIKIQNLLSNFTAVGRLILRHMNW